MDEYNHDLMLKITGIKKESLDRRKNRSGHYGKHHSYFDDTDLPVSENYIDQVLLCEKELIQIDQRSNWLNSISITIRSNDIELIKNKILPCIASKPFVDSIDLVNRYKKPYIKSKNEKSNHNNHNKNNYNKLKNIKLLNNNNQHQNSITYDESFYGKSFSFMKQCNIDKLHKMGYTGKGVRILITDTGFYKQHDVFKKLNIIDEYNFVNNTKETEDSFNGDASDVEDSQNDHGTATLSLLGAYNPGILIGAAYDAEFLLARTESLEIEDIIEEDYWASAVEWGEKNGANLVSCSLGYQDWYNVGTDFDGTVSHMSKIAEISFQKGVIIVTGVGNSGSEGIGAPSDAQYVISVGAVDRTGEVVDFSSIGPTSDGRIKPEVMALGDQVYLASIINSSSYIIYNGTSFSCPIVASGIALLIQAHPTWTSYEIYDAVVQSASESSKPTIYKGYGIFDAYKTYLYKPKSKDCTINKCQNNGICCQKKCHCTPGYYGYLCQYKRLECGDRCSVLNGTCQINQNNQPSYLCVKKDDIKNLYSDSDVNIDFKNCTNLIETNTNIPYQLSNKLIINLNLNLILLIFILILFNIC